MSGFEIRTGMIVKMKDGPRWRLIYSSGLNCRLVQMDISKRVAIDMSSSEIANLVTKGDAFLEEDIPVHVNTSALSVKEKEKFDHKAAFINEFMSLYGPDFTSFFKGGKKQTYVELYTRHGFCQSTADRIVRTWLQSGCQMETLAVMRKTERKPYKYSKKTGRPSFTAQGIVLDEKAMEAFAFGLEEYKRGRQVSIRDAYVRLTNEFYLEEQEGHIVLAPADKRPTERQFRNFLSRTLSCDEVEKIKTSVREYQNNSRLLLSGPLDPTLSPGRILEADALEVDINIVSSFDTEQNISRPILYILVDKYSHAIVAFHVGFDNNSMMGLSSLMMNLFDDKKELLKNRNIDIDPSSWWPEPFIPREIRCDRGSDFASDQFSEICRQLNIERTLEPGAMGSMKGLVEESFRLFHLGIRADFERYGFISKRHDSNHKREACLTIDEMFLLTVDFVKFHNTFYTKNRKLSRDMMKEKVEKSPSSIWAYGVRKFGNPIPVTHLNRSKLLYSLMKEDQASISREGICLHGLYYTTLDQKILLKMKTARNNAGRRDTQGNRLNSMVVRRDPRSINTLYYISDNELKMLNINPAKCGGLKDMTWEEYEDYRRLERQKDTDGDIANLLNKVRRKNVNEMILASTNRNTYADAKDILPARKAEKNRQNFENSIQKRLSEKPSERQYTPPAPYEQELCPALASPVTDSEMKNDSEKTGDEYNDLIKLMFGDNY